MVRRVVGFCAVGVLVAAGLVVGGGATPAGASVAPEWWNTTSATVFPNQLVSLHWGQCGVAAFCPLPTSPYFNITTPDFPVADMSFSNETVTPISGGYEVSGTPQNMELEVPSVASGTTYHFSLQTCDASTSECSTGVSSVTLTVASSFWQQGTYTSDFSRLQKASETQGSGLDVTYDAADDVWNSNEFSNTISRVLSTGSAQTKYADSSNVNGQTGVLAKDPFGWCFASPCTSSASSALRERIILGGDGQIWSTFGGWPYFPSGQTVANRSEVVAFNTSTKHFCTYVLPGDDNEAMGVAWAHNWVWVIETKPGASELDGFDPSTISGCSSTANKAVDLPSSVQLLNITDGPGSVETFPALVTADPDNNHLWIGTNGGWAGVREIDISTPGTPTDIADYQFSSTNADAVLGAYPWEIAADSNYVYAIDYGDDNLVRIDKGTGHTDTVALPIYCDCQEGYGLAIDGTRLYFTMADDGALSSTSPPAYPMSTIGYIDLSTWAAASQPTTAVMYDFHLTEAVQSNNLADFRGIAADSAGQLAIMDANYMVRLTP